LEYIFHGQHDTHWIGKYDYYRDVLKLAREIEKLRGLFKISQNAGWWKAYSDFCIISERHTTLYLDNNDQPHCEDGLAIGYPDGWGVYAWHGVRVPEYVILRPHEITPEKIAQAKLQNSEVAQVMSERYTAIRNGNL
jgi:hypothetical protein